MPESRVCNYCEAKVEQNAKYCSECATQIWIECPSCHSKLRTNPKTIVCSECGTTLENMPVKRVKEAPKKPSIFDRLINGTNGSEDTALIKLLTALLTAVVTAIPTYLANNQMGIAIGVGFAGLLIGYIFGRRVLKAIGGMVAGVFVGAIGGGIVGGISQSIIEKIVGGAIAWAICALVAGGIGVYLLQKIDDNNDYQMARWIFILSFVFTSGIVASIASSVMPGFALEPSSSASAANWFMYWAKTWAGGYGAAGIVWGAVFGFLDVKFK